MGSRPDRIFGKNNHPAPFQKCWTKATSCIGYAAPALHSWAPIRRLRLNPRLDRKRCAAHHCDA
jgi:hypothetical protein